jgi:hypothetical protein
MTGTKGATSGSESGNSWESWEEFTDHESAPGGQKPLKARPPEFGWKWCPVHDYVIADKVWPKYKRGGGPLHRFVNAVSFVYELIFKRWRCPECGGFCRRTHPPPWDRTPRPPHREFDY